MANTTTGASSNPAPAPAGDTSQLEAVMAQNQAFQLKLATLQQKDQMIQAANHAMQQSAQNIR